ncbi:MAG: c-type cytochrome [Porticoccaceae bacterium]
MNKMALNLSALAWVAATASAPAHATDVAEVAELAKASGCFSCHSVGEKVVGPAFAAVAEKYAGQKDAVAELAMSIQNGSVRKWGRVPMPPHASLPAEDVKRLAEWVMATKR